MLQHARPEWQAHALMTSLQLHLERCTRRQQRESVSSRPEQHPQEGRTPRPHGAMGSRAAQEPAKKAARQAASLHPHRELRRDAACWKQPEFPNMRLMLARAKDLVTPMAHERSTGIRRANSVTMNEQIAQQLSLNEMQQKLIVQTPFYNYCWMGGHDSPQERSALHKPAQALFQK